MINGNSFIRNVYLGDLLENFLVAAISSILFIRFFLAITSYPQIGSGMFHIAHMLWGGFLLMIALVLTLSFLGNKVLRIASIIGGIGFGVFIDELGKFITSDNDYFFEPTIAILYFVFLALVFIFHYIEKHRPLTEKEYVMNAFEMFEEVVSNDMDREEKRKLMQYIKHAKNYPFAQHLEALAKTIEVTPTKKPNFLQQTYYSIIDFFDSFIESILFRKLIIIFFVLQGIIMFGNIMLIAAFKIGSIPFFVPIIPENIPFSIYGEIFSIILTGVFVVFGIIYFRFSRERAYEMFKYSVFASILITQFFVFYREQFQALIGLTINIIVLVVLNFIIEHEKKQKGKLPHTI